MNAENEATRGSNARRSWSSATSWLVVLGLLLRLYHYGRNPSMWHDEAATVMNVLTKSFAGLLGPLDVSATGPTLFLWMQKCVSLVLGDSTYALRLVSLLASCAGLIVFARFVQKQLAPIPAACATLLIACSDRLLWHASEARHYSSDFLFAAVLLALLACTREWSPVRRAIFFTLLAPIVIFGSYPGVFLCGGVFIALLPELRKNARASTLLATGLLGATIVVAFAAFYLVTIRVQRSAAMDAAWVHTFPDWNRAWTVPLWAVTSTVSVVDYLCRPIGGILIVPAFIGAARLWRNGRRDFVLFATVPMLLAMLAALPKCYPYTGARTMVFAMPALVLLIAAGLERILEQARSPRLVVRATLAILLIPLAATLGFSVYRVIAPWPRANTSGASAYVLARRQPNEPVTANHWEYNYYFRGLGSSFYSDLGLLEDAKRPARFWLVLTSGDPRDRETILDSVDGWQTMDRREFENSTVFLLSRKEP
jgi:hypothetical protein